MIKADVTVIGTIKRSAAIRNDKNNKPYVSFTMGVVLNDQKNKGQEVELFVTIPSGQQGDLPRYVEGKRVAVQGTLDIRKRNDKLVFYLTADDIQAKTASDLDAISGTLHFRGHLRNENVYEERTDRKGNPFIMFYAYSSEKVGDSFVSTWIRFLRFPEKGEGIESIKPQWIRPKVRATIDGDLQVSVYEGDVRLSCLVKSMEEYVKQ